MPKELKGHLDEYILEEEIGVGVTSHVYRAIRKSTGQRVAVKIIEKHSMTACMFAKEARVQRLIHHHPNIATIIDSFATDSEYVLVQQLAPYGDLATAIINGELDNPLRAFCDVVHAIHALHSNGITHRDIKPENILLTENQICVLSDFGHACVASEAPGGSSAGCGGRCGCTECEGLEWELGSPVAQGTRAYLAPEALACRTRASFAELDFQAVDIWAMGIMLYTLLTGGFPWEEASDSPEMTSYRRYLATGELDFRDWFFPDEKTEHEVGFLLRGMLSIDLQMRFTIHHVRHFVQSKWDPAVTRVRAARPSWGHRLRQLVAGRPVLRQESTQHLNGARSLGACEGPPRPRSQWRSGREGAAVYLALLLALYYVMYIS